MSAQGHRPQVGTGLDGSFYSPPTENDNSGLKSKQLRPTKLCAASTHRTGYFGVSQPPQCDTLPGTEALDMLVAAL